MKFSSILALIGLWLTSLTVTAQRKKDKVTGETERLYQQALDAAGYGDMPKAISLLQQIIKQDGQYQDAYFSLAGIYGEQRQFQQSIATYEKGKAIQPDRFLYLWLPYGINKAAIGDFSGALAATDSFLAIPNLKASMQADGERRRKQFQFAVDYIRKNGISSIQPSNLGDSVNTQFSEYFPSMTIDGKTLVFTRRLQHRNEDFFETQSLTNGYSYAIPLPGAINTTQNEGAQCISIDGEWLLFTGCNFSDGYGSCDLYISYKTQVGWSRPENLGSPINSDAWEAQPSLSPDKQQLYFSSNRPGGLGGSDIYVANRLPNGKWGPPINLGPNINTSGDESTPFIHPDNQSLYFTSTGHPGFGGSDLFIAKKDSSQYFQQPFNLGYPINTTENEGSLIVAAGGKMAFYASDRTDTRGGLDLYTFQLPEHLRPLRTLWVSGQVTDSITRKGIPALVELVDLDLQQTVGRVQTDEVGKYLITLPVPKNYAFSVNRKGYLFYSDQYLGKFISDNDSAYQKNIALQPLIANAKVVLKNIFFQSGSYELAPTSRVELLKVVQLLKENPTLTIRINGHTDAVGSAAANQTLSQQRAQSVIQFLSQQGISAKRLQAKGFGQTQPIAGNNTEEGRAQNRRTELQVIAQ